MKKWIFSVAVALALFSIFPVFADESEYYPITVKVEKIYVARDGYRIIYRKSGVDLGEVHIPMDWLKAGGKCEFVNARPWEGYYLVAFYKNGEFSHCRVTAPEYFTTSLWSPAPNGYPAEKFNVESLDLTL